VNDATDTPAITETRRSRSGFILTLLGHFGSDATVAVIWAALIVAIVLFSGVVSQFAYVDF
jgi:hypothetical protein